MNKAPTERALVAGPGRRTTTGNQGATTKQFQAPGYLDRQRLWYAVRIGTCATLNCGAALEATYFTTYLPHLSEAFFHLAQPIYYLTMRNTLAGSKYASG